MQLNIFLITHETSRSPIYHDDVIKWKHFPRYWPFVRGIHRSPVNSPHKGQWRGALMFSLICTRINGWVNNGEPGDFRRHRVHYDVIVMIIHIYSKMTFDEANKVKLVHISMLTYTQHIYICILNYNKWLHISKRLYMLFAAMFYARRFPLAHTKEPHWNGE